MTSKSAGLVYRLLTAEPPFSGGWEGRRFKSADYQ